jgi:hypothetical protein
LDRFFNPGGNRRRSALTAALGQTRSFGDIGSMSGLPESGHEWAINGAATPSAPEKRAPRRHALDLVK